MASEAKVRKIKVALTEDQLCMINEAIGCMPDKAKAQYVESDLIALNEADEVIHRHWEALAMIGKMQKEYEIVE